MSNCQTWKYAGIPAIILSLAILGPNNLFAQQKPLEPESVKPLVEQLGSQSYRVREQAQKSLEDLGSRAIEPLRQSLKATQNPEVERRLETLIERIEHNRLTTATMVTVKADKQPVSKVVKEICTQAGYSFNESMPKDKLVTVEMINVPFWQAIRKVCSLANVHCNVYEDEAVALHFYNSNQTFNPFVTTHGPVEIMANNINCNRSLQLAGIPIQGNRRQNNEYLGISFQLHSEPKTPLLGVLSSQAVKAVDDKGVSMLPKSSPDYSESRYHSSYIYKSYSQSFGINLMRGDRTATSIKELKGEVTVSILRETRPDITVENVGEAKKKSFIGRSIQMDVDDMNAQKSAVSATLTFRQKTANPNDYSWYSNIYQRLEMVDQDGVKLLSRGLNEQRTGAGVVTLKMTFSYPFGNNKEFKSGKLILNEWITIPKTYQFEFKDIPLP